MKPPVILHPFLFALFPVLALLSHNLAELTLGVAVRPAAVILGVVLVVWVTLARLGRDPLKAGLLVSLGVVLFFSYGQFFLLVWGWVLGPLELGRHRYLLPLWAMIFLVGSYFICRARSALPEWTRIANATAGLLVLSSAITLGVQQTRRMGVQPTRVQQEAPRLHLRRPAAAPDIYYIILDRYGSADVLRRSFQYDNSLFLDFLKKKGFFVTQSSQANYPTTWLSLASSLNMRYLDSLTATLGRNTKDRAVAYQMLQNHRVGQLLKAAGYRYVHVGSNWGPTRANVLADENVGPPRPLSEFSAKLCETTALLPFYFQRELRGIRNRTLLAFNKLERIAPAGQPKFVFAHLLIPHEPYVFNRDGSRPTPTELASRTEKESYLEQLEYANARMTKIIDRWLNGPGPPPVVILQSDEGPILQEYPRKDPYETFATPEEITIRKRILNAYYLPGSGKPIPYDTISPVNSFRLIFNRYFGAALQMLPDETYIYHDERTPYDFRRIAEHTGELHHTASR